MPPLRDLTGRKFGRLTVINRAESDTFGHARWNCLCECGKYHIVSGSNLLLGHVKSCGCLNEELAGGRLRKHGMHGSRINRIWKEMRHRCNNVKNTSYENYGGRGIRVCSEWNNPANGFINFYNWAISNGYEDNLSIDRIDNDGNYCPENCRWADLFEQGSNKRNNVRITVNGINHTLAEWARIMGVKRSFLISKLKSGCSLEEILADEEIEVE